MSAGAYMLAHDLDLIGQVASAAIDAQYPGIQIQFPAVSGGLWSVQIPTATGGTRISSGTTLAEAIAGATR